MKESTLILVLVIGLFSFSYAQTKEASIRKLFHLMKEDSTATKMLNSMLPAIVGNKMNQSMDSTEKAKTQATMKLIRESVKKIIALVKEDKVKLYDKYFTLEEINSMIMFYKSPAGRKYVSVTPEITKEITMKIIQRYLPEMKEEMKEKMENKQN
jgi:hypothetical protein